MILKILGVIFVLIILFLAGTFIEGLVREISRLRQDFKEYMRFKEEMRNKTDYRLGKLERRLKDKFKP